MMNSLRDGQSGTDGSSWVTVTTSQGEARQDSRDKSSQSETSQSGSSETSQSCSSETSQSESSRSRKRICMIGVSIERFYKIRYLVRRILNFGFEKIYICIPRTTRCGESFIGVSELNLPPKVEILRGTDYGEVTPIVYSSMISTRNIESIFVMNDSISIHKNPIPILESKLNGKNVTGLLGACAGIFPFNFQLINGHPVDWLFLDGMIGFKSGQFDTRKLANYRPELIDFPGLRFATWCESMKIELFSVDGPPKDYITSTRRQFDFKTLKKAFELRWYGIFKKNYWKFFYRSLGFLTLVILALICVMIWSLSLKVMIGGAILIGMIFKIFTTKFIF